MKINNFFSKCVSCLSKEEVAGRYGFGCEVLTWQNVGLL